MSDSKIDISPKKEQQTDGLEKIVQQENSEIQFQSQADQNMDSILINDYSKQEQQLDMACQLKDWDSPSIKSLQAQGANIPGSPGKKLNNYSKQEQLDKDFQSKDWISKSIQRLQKKRANVPGSHEKLNLRASNENTKTLIPLGTTTKNAIILAKNATISDKNGHYGDACILYENAVGLFLQALELEPLSTKNTKDTIQALCKELQCRGEMLKLFGRPAPKFAKSNEEIQSLLETLEESEPKIDSKENCNSIIENLDKSSFDEPEEKEKVRKDLNCERLKIKETQDMQKLPQHILEPLDITALQNLYLDYGILDKPTAKKAMKLLKDAMNLDEARSFENACKQYEKSIQLFFDSLYFEKHGDMEQEAIESVCRQFQDRADQLQSYVNDEMKGG